MSNRLFDLLVFVAESALPFHARPPASIRRRSAGLEIARATARPRSRGAAGDAVVI